MSEISDTVALLQIGGKGSYYLLKGAVKGTLYLLQTYKKMHKKGLLSQGEVKNFETFIQATDGKYSILNIPTEDPKEIIKIKEDLDKLKVSYTVLPDLNVGDGQIQIAYAAKDAAKAENWYRSYCLDRLQPGGEKSYQDLMHLTEGQVTILNIPWPQDQKTEEHKLTPEKELHESLEREKIIHKVLPSTESGRKQILVPQMAEKEAKEWYEKYRKVKGHPETGDSRMQSVEEYLEAGTIDEYAYVSTMPEETKVRLDGKNMGKQAAAEPMEAWTAAQQEMLPEELKEKELRMARLPLPEPADDGKSIGTEFPKEPVGTSREASLERLKQDLDRLHVNYVLLPDLHVGDGYIQIAFATADTQKVQAWYQAYQEDMLRSGVEMADVKEMEMQEYLNTGKSQGEKTMADPEEQTQAYKKTDTKNRFNNFDQREYQSDFHAALEKMSGQKQGQFINNTKYQEQRNHPDMLEFSVNEQLVISNPEDRMFISRIPGSKEEYLCVPAGNVYRTDEGKTYGILIHQKDPVTIVDKNGSFLRKEAAGDVQKHYSPIRKGMEAAKKTKLPIVKPKLK